MWRFCGWEDRHAIAHRHGAVAAAQQDAYRLADDDKHGYSDSFAHTFSHSLTDAGCL